MERTVFFTSYHLRRGSEMKKDRWMTGIVPEHQGICGLMQEK